jgi:hypothetical protein
MIKTTILAAGMIAMGSSAFAAQNSCDISAYNFCAESETFDLSSECAQNQGTVGTTCSNENQIGTCKVTESNESMTLHYYNGFPANAEENCAENNGTWTRG